MFNSCVYGISSRKRRKLIRCLGVGRRSCIQNSGSSWTTWVAGNLESQWTNGWIDIYGFRISILQFTRHNEITIIYLNVSYDSHQHPDRVLPHKTLHDRVALLRGNAYREESFGSLDANLHRNFRHTHGAHSSYLLPLGHDFLVS